MPKNNYFGAEKLLYNAKINHLLICESSLLVCGRVGGEVDDLANPINYNITKHMDRNKQPVKGVIFFAFCSSVIFFIYLHIYPYQYWNVSSLTAKMDQTLSSCACWVEGGQNCPSRRTTIALLLWPGLAFLPSAAELLAASPLLPDTG